MEKVPRRREREERGERRERDVPRAGSCVGYGQKPVPVIIRGRPKYSKTRQQKG